VTYRLVQLAPGSYDVELDGKVVASVVRNASTTRWAAELLDESAPYPAPFTEVEHRFASFADVATWLGEVEVIPTPGGDFARRTILSRR
jgi:hypothetical protein